MVFRIKRLVSSGLLLAVFLSFCAFSQARRLKTPRRAPRRTPVLKSLIVFSGLQPAQARWLRKGFTLIFRNAVKKTRGYRLTPVFVNCGPDKLRFELRRRTARDKFVLMMVITPRVLEGIRATHGRGAATMVFPRRFRKLLQRCKASAVRSILNLDRRPPIKKKRKSAHGKRRAKAGKRKAGKTSRSFTASSPAGTVLAFSATSAFGSYRNQDGTPSGGRGGGGLSPRFLPFASSSSDDDTYTEVIVEDSNDSNNNNSSTEENDPDNPAIKGEISFEIAGEDVSIGFSVSLDEVKGAAEEMANAGEYGDGVGDTLLDLGAAAVNFVCNMFDDDNSYDDYNNYFGVFDSLGELPGGLYW